MLSRIKGLTVVAMCVSALLLGGCYTSFTSLYVPSNAYTAYVIEEYDEDESMEVYAYYTWYDYFPIYRPRQVQYYYFGDAFIDFYVNRPVWYRHVYYDPWLEFHWGSGSWFFAWQSYSWHNDPYHQWYDSDMYPSHSYGWYDHAAWNGYHSDQYYNHSQRPFTTRGVPNKDMRHEQAAYQKQTSQKPVSYRDTHSDQNVPMKKAEVASRSVINAKGSAPSTQMQDDRIKRVQINRQSTSEQTYREQVNLRRQSTSIQGAVDTHPEKEFQIPAIKNNDQEKKKEVVKQSPDIRREVSSNQKIQSSSSKQSSDKEKSSSADQSKKVSQRSSSDSDTNRSVSRADSGSLPSNKNLSSRMKNRNSR